MLDNDGQSAVDAVEVLFEVEVAAFSRFVDGIDVELLAKKSTMY